MRFNMTMQKRNKYSIRAKAALASFSLLALAAYLPHTAYAVGRPVYRIYNTISHQHLQTLDQNEITDLTTYIPAWINETSTFSAQPPVAGSCGSGMSPAYRIVNGLTGDHFLTSDNNEYLILTNNGTNRSLFYSEGVDFCVNLTQVTGTVPVQRLFNPVTTYHFVTADNNEASYLITHGWRSEGIAFYAY